MTSADQADNAGQKIQSAEVAKTPADFSAFGPDAPRPLSRRNIITRLVLLIILIGASIWTLCGRPEPVGQAEGPTTWTGTTMGTQWTVKVTGSTADHAEMQRGIQAVVGGIDDAMSTWKPDSEVSRFNEAPADVPFSISSKTMEVIELSQQIAHQSGGAFDPTIGPLIEAWGFNTADVGTWTRPREADIERAQGRVDFHRLHLERSTSTVRKTRSDLELDLSAVAKGFAVDEVARWLDERGFTDYMVEIGGEARVRGYGGAQGRAWRIGIERPDPDGVAVHAVVELRDESLATSGTYRNFFASEGQRLSHLIDPRTGAPVSHSTVSVTVRHASCAVADAWATALLVLGSEKGSALAEELGLAVLFADQDDGTLARTATSTFGPFEVVD